MYYCATCAVLAVSSCTMKAPSILDSTETGREALEDQYGMRGDSHVRVHYSGTYANRKANQA